jgi:hypothetical protein
LRDNSRSRWRGGSSGGGGGQSAVSHALCIRCMGPMRITGWADLRLELVCRFLLSVMGPLVGHAKPEANPGMCLLHHCISAPQPLTG